MNRLRRAMRIGAQLEAVPRLLHGTELSQKKLQDNICLKYEIMPQETCANCDGCRKKLSVDHILLCTQGGIVLELYGSSAKEWRALR